MIQNKFLRVLSFFIFPAIVFLICLFLDSGLKLSDPFPWIDIPMHFFGGVSVGYMSLLFLRFFKEENLIEVKNKFIFVLVILMSVSMIAVLWEFWEFGMVYFFKVGWVFGYEDTLFDLFMGMLGGLSVAIFSKV